MSSAPYAVVDTNVIVSSFLSKREDSSSSLIVSWMAEGKLIPIVNGEILAEYREVLSRPKFRLDPKSVSGFFEMVAKAAVFIEPKDFFMEFPDPDDRIFYGTYRAAQFLYRPYLVTWNLKHFPIEEMIMDPKDFLFRTEVLDRYHQA